MPCGFFFLTLIINCCLLLSYFPQKWKHAKVVAIKKPNKPPSQPTSYRPISLLSSISKILERVILTRLTEHLTLNNIIPYQQHGFRPGRSTTTLLHDVTNKIRQAKDSKQSTGMILLDAEKAFDRVWVEGLIFKMIKTNTPHYIIKIVYSFLTNRSFQVWVGNKLSTTKYPKFGVPQGAVLSPTLYSLNIYDIPTAIICELAIFADDVAFYISSRFFKNIEKSLQSAFNKLVSYFKLWKVTINSEKSQAIFFTNRRTKQLPVGPIRLGQNYIEWEQNVKYLGVEYHVEYAVNKVMVAIRILYSLLKGWHS